MVSDFRPSLITDIYSFFLLTYRLLYFSSYIIVVINFIQKNTMRQL